MRLNKCYWSWSIAIVVGWFAVGVAHAELIGHWTFDDVEGEKVPDSSSNMNHGQLMFGATTSDDIPDFFNTGASLSINGGEEHVLVPHDESLNVEELITIAAWVKPIGNVEWDGIVAKNPGDGSNLNHAGNYELRIENNSRGVTFLHQQDGVDDTLAYPSGPPVQEDVWQHIAVTVDEENVNFFLDGQARGTAPLQGFFGFPNESDLYIGSRADLFTAMDGLIDDVRIYDEVLSEEAIQELCGCEPDPPPPPSLPVTIESVSSELVSTFNRGAENLVNGSGLNPDGSHTITPDGNMWLNAGNGCCGDPEDPLIPEAQVTFDLGEEVSIDRMKVWNYNENLPGRPELLLRGAETADILTAGEDQEFTLFASEVELDLAPGDAFEEFGQDIDLDGIVARYVRLDLLGNHGGDNDFIGLSEVQFFGGSSVNGDFNGNGELDVEDIDLLTGEVIQMTDNLDFDVNGDGALNNDDRVFWVEDLKNTWFGDANLSGEFNSSDLVQVFQRAKYETGESAGWGDGDWDGDGVFASGDLVLAFQSGGYEQGQRPAVIPEPSSLVLMLGLFVGILGHCRRGA